MKLTTTTAFLLALLCWVPTSYASDHIDGPITTEHAISDLADFYMFPSPSRDNHLVLIMNTHFAAYSSNHFNEGIVYEFHLKRASLDIEGKQVETSGEKTISCSFETPHHHHAHKVNCTSDFGVAVSGPTEQIVESEGIRVFTGLRSDPFFFNFFWVQKVVSEGVIEAPTNDDIMLNLNALSIVVEVDLAKLYPDQVKPLIAGVVSATSLGEHSERLEQLDFIGRPEITNVTMAARGGEDVRDEYNTLAPFALANQDWSKYHQRVFENVAFFDTLDSAADWTDQERINLTNLLMTDALLLDTSLPCVHGENFLAIEKALLEGELSASCGGRLLEDDFVDILVSYYIQKNRSPMIADGVDAPHKSVLSVFPYLNEPEISRAGYWAMKKARFLNWLASWF
ncbi:MAG: DUF4331 family protein [Bdellovibrionales bacterium]|nr:DUF4331 family protein [Bdellovibrionales bacterium]